MDSEIATPPALKKNGENMFETLKKASAPDEDFKYILDKTLRKFPLLGVTMSKLKFIPDDKVRTAGTDNKNVYYSPRFFATLSDEEKVFVTAHEILHVAFDHVLRSKGKNHTLWNTATDAVINQILKSENLPLVDGGVDKAEALNKSAEEMYEQLLKEREEKKKNAQQQGGGKKQQGNHNADSQNNANSQQRESGEKSQNEPEQCKNDSQNKADDKPADDGKSSSDNNTNPDDVHDAGQNDSNANDDKAARQHDTDANDDNGAGQSDANADDDTDTEQSNTNTNDDNASGQSDTGTEDDFDDENDFVGHDSHDLWKKAVEWADKENDKEQTADVKHMSPQDKADKTHCEDETAQTDDSKDIDNPKDESDKTDNLKDNFEKHFAQLNRHRRREMANQIREMLEQKKKEHLSAYRAESYGDVGESTSVLDWKKVLKKTLDDEQDRWSYRRSNADNDYMARVETLEDEERAETQVLLDTSGSVNAPLLREFLRQLKPLLKTSKLSVGCFDTNFYGFTEIKTKSDIDNFTIKGGGGTDLDLAAKSFGKGKDINKIVFTDGYPGTMPTPETKNINVLWLVYGNPTYSPICGKVIQVDKTQILNFTTRPHMPNQNGR